MFVAGVSIHPVRCEGEQSEFTVAADVKVYLCDPYIPWRHGSNESSNRLL